MFYKIAVDTPFNNSLLTYVSKEKKFSSGTLVKVPLGKREAWGCVLHEVKSLDFDSRKIKNVSENLDNLELNLKLNEEQLELYQWIANYYHYPLGQLIFDTLPKFLKRPRKLIYHIGNERKNYELNPEQKNIADDIKSRLDEGFSRNLIHGITGSGKSIIFLELIREMIKAQKSVLFMIPEINLTHEFLDFFKNTINAPVYLYNSSLSASDRYSLWANLNKGDNPSLVIGSRSSVFLPINNLGLIIVDEEHDASFKQDDRCAYNGRDVALKRASFLNIPIVLGSATPSVETYYNFTEVKNYGNYYLLLKRHGSAGLPEIVLVNSASDVYKNDKIWPFTEEALGQIAESLVKNQQVIVFANRLGFANFIQCSSCGYRFECHNCSVNLRYFKKKNQLACSYCDLKMELPLECPVCQNMNLIQLGFGTEKLESILKERFPNARLGRFDRDEIKTNKDLNARLKQFHNHEVDIIIGTQMLSKGHNFKNVNKVIVLGIDSQLNVPDFRANEKVYQLLTQISGRAGRYSDKGYVYIQTLNPDNDIFKVVKEYDFKKFYGEEFNLRKLCSCPPYTKMAMIYFSSQDQTLVGQVAGEMAHELKTQVFKLRTKEISVLGARASLIEKRANMFTWSIMIRSQFVGPLHELTHWLKKEIQAPGKIPPKVVIKIDIDPYNIF